MATPAHTQSPSNGISPQSYATQHARPQSSFRGSARIGDYKVEAKLGEGTFGEVHRAVSRKSGQVVALKKILMHNEKDGFPITALREIKLLKLLNHTNILRLEEMAIEHHTREKDRKKRAIMYMVTPYMDHDLCGLLENPAVKFTVPQIKCYMLQLLEGTRYLHDQHILHRDMKAANLLINNQGILQIADFGLARHYDEPVPVAGGGGGTARRDYTTLVVTRWYRPPELLMQLRRYTTAIDLWGVGCVFGEMLIGKPILSGDSDTNQLKIIFELVGSPTEETMPGWTKLPGAAGLSPPQTPGNLSQVFREHGSGAILLLKELLKLDWKKRTNAIDALKHSYFRNAPLPCKPEDIPQFEESHELDRKKFRNQKAALPPAPKGGTVGKGSENPSEQSYGNGNGDTYHQRPHNGTRHPPPPHGAYSNGVPPPPPREERRPAWTRREDRSEPRQELRPDPRHQLPPRPPPPPADYNYDGGRSERRDRDWDRDRRGGPPSRNGGPNVDTYIPSYGHNERPPRSRDERPPRDERLPREERPRDDRPPRDERPRDERIPRDDRPPPRDEYRRRTTRSRSGSPHRERDQQRDSYRDHTRDRDYRRRS